LGFRVTEENTDNFVVRLVFLNIGDRGDFNRDGSSLLGYPLNDFSSSSTTFVVNRSGGTLDEPLQSGETLDVEFARGSLFNGSVNLSELDVGSRGGELLSSGSEFRSELLAVTAPGSIELNQSEVKFRDGVIEVAVSEDNNTFFSGPVVS